MGNGVMAIGPQLPRPSSTLPCRQVMKREPASNAFVLQIRMESVGENLILARVADEAGIELNSFITQRMQVFKVRGDLKRTGREYARLDEQKAVITHPVLDRRKRPAGFGASHD